MTQFPNRRLVAATALAAILTVFALPVAAAPAGSWTLDGWQASSFLSWFDSLWTGLFGVPGHVEHDSPEAGGPSSMGAALRGGLEPDGVSVTSTAPDGVDPMAPAAFTGSHP